MRKRWLFLLCLIWPSSLLGASLENGVATKVVIWFFDAVTQQPKTGITVTTPTCRIVKADMTTASFSPTVAGGGTHDMAELGNGAYSLEIPAADLSVNGPFDVGCSVSGSASPPTVYDVKGSLSYGLTIDNDVATPSTFWAEPKAGAAASSYGELLNNMLNVPTGDISAKTDLLPAVTPAGSITGTAQSGSSNTIRLQSDFPNMLNVNRGNLIAIIGGTGFGQTALITSYDNATQTATVSVYGSSTGNWITNPNSTSIYVVIPAK